MVSEEKPHCFYFFLLDMLPPTRRSLMPVTDDEPEAKPKSFRALESL